MNNKYLRVLLSVLLVSLITRTGSASELVLLGGYTGSDNFKGDTYAWQIQYMKNLSEHFAYSISYINQGHFHHHHRDADAVSIWYRKNLIYPNLYFGVGGGFLFYYDTVYSKNAPAQDSHGWGTIASISTNWYLDDTWFIQMQGNWINTSQSFDTFSTLLGIGYQFDSPVRNKISNEEIPTQNEVTLFGGVSIVNIPGSENFAATALEYRRSILGHLDWTLGGLYEGKSNLIDRYGLTSQFWLKESFFNERISLGVGFGGYLATDRQRADKDEFLSEIFSMTGSFKLTNHWSLRAVWDRIITNYDRDSDVIMCGIGYHF